MDVAPQLEEGLAGHYHIVRLLGEGGMALVYLADDLKHGRQVALKVLRPETSIGSEGTRFRREIQVAARLNHPNILALHDSGETNGLQYFVMPHVEGDSLRTRLDRDGPLPVEEALRVAREVGDALAYAHGMGLVHRDIKPENILFQAGHAMVCDFGIAQVAEETGRRLTRTGVAVGTIDYMSPEQFDADLPVDQRTDVYALGCMLHEMLAGTPPFRAGTPQATLARKLAGGAPSLPSTRTDVPGTLQAVIHRAMSIDPTARQNTATDLVTDLDEAVTRRAVEADARTRHRRRLLHRATLALGAVAVGATAWWGAHALGGPRMDRIAVLPFRNAVNDTAQDFYVDGVHHDLVVELSKAIRVINPGSVAQYAGTTLPIREIAAELGVDGVVQGSVTRRSNQVAIDLQMVDRDTEEIVWSQAFQTSPGNILALYHDAARAIADQMGVVLSSEVLAKLAISDEVDPQVYDLLLQARFHGQKLTPAGIDTAEEYYRLALERDSLSAEAWWGLGAVWFMRAQQGLVSGADAIARGEPFKAKAEELDPSLASIHSQRALNLTWSGWRFRDALVAFEQALDDDPTDSLLRAYYSQLLLYLDRDAEATEEVERAASLDPFNTLVQGVYAQDLVFLKRYGEAEAVLQRVRERDPEAPYVLSTLRTTYHLMGRHEEAMEMWEASYRAAGDDEAVAALKNGYGRGGYAEALRAVAELFETRSQARYVTPWQIATLYTRAGETEQALDYLEKAYADHDQNMPYIAVDPIFDFIRDEPRFQALVDSLGLPR
ncbi:MAG TPA: protein kinase [Longimicrobiales bacterium]|nr:protein kinase [Longimicrobiales bacterium]